MEVAAVKAFACDAIDKALIRSEWEKWVRSLKLYLDSEDINNPLKRRNKLLHYGGLQLQEVAYNLPGAVEDYDPDRNNDIFTTLVSKLNEYFCPQQTQLSKGTYSEI